MGRKKPKRRSTTTDDDEVGLVDPPMSEEEIERLRARGYEIRTHGKRTTASARKPARVLELWGKTAAWRQATMRAAYKAHDGFLQRAASERHFGLAPEGEDPRRWLAALEKSLLGRSDRSSIKSLTAQDADLRAAFLLGVRETVSKLEDAEIQRVEGRGAGGSAGRGKTGWFSKLLRALCDSDKSLPSRWVDLRTWVEGASSEDLEAAGIRAVCVEERGDGEHVVAEMCDGKAASVSRQAATKTASRLRKRMLTE